MSEEPYMAPAVRPRCANCKMMTPTADLVSVDAMRLCVPCAERIVPGGVKSIWSQKI